VIGTGDRDYSEERSQRREEQRQPEPAHVTIMPQNADTISGCNRGA
jgi:hypothetical protein